MVLARSQAQKRHDFANAREYEEYVAERLGVTCHTRFNAVDDLDIWVPGFFVEVKEKNQHFGKRWHILSDVIEENLFIVDELTVRKALRWYPEVFYLLRDNVGDPTGPRLFLAPIWELIAVERERVDRVGQTGHLKGKWVLDLSKFRRISDEADIPEIALSMLTSQEWKKSECLGGTIGQV